MDKQYSNFTDESIALEKVDILRDRLGVSYQVARDALIKNNGNLIEALVMLEQEKNKDVGQKIAKRVGSLLAKGNATKVRIKRDGQTVAEIPATLGAVGLLTTLSYTPLAVAGAIGSITAMFNRYTLEVKRKDGQVTEHPIMEEDQPSVEVVVKETDV